MAKLIVALKRCFVNDVDSDITLTVSPCLQKSLFSIKVPNIFFVSFKNIGSSFRYFTSITGSTLTLKPIVWSKIYEAMLPSVRLYCSRNRILMFFCVCELFKNPNA
jgi:hypothetical protein